MARRISFFAAGNDLHAVLNEVEDKFRIKFTQFGWSNGPEPEFLDHAADLPELGIATADQQCNCDQFLIVERGTGTINPVLKYGDTLTAYSTGDHPSRAFSESIPNARYKEIDLSTNEVIRRGVVSANTCGRVAASPPGEVILFVRSRNFREKVHDWKARESFPF